MCSVAADRSCNVAAFALFTISPPDENIELAGKAFYVNRGVAYHLAVDFYQSAWGIKRLYAKS